MLNHKHHSRILTWLNELSSQKYLKKYYSQKFAGEPAYYSLGTKGRKYFKEHKDVKGISEPLLDRVWHEHGNSLQFKRHCLLLADIYLSLIKLTGETKSKLAFYTNVEVFGMKYMIKPEPLAYFSIEDDKGIIKRYFLDIFDYFNQENMRKRVNNYLFYFKKQIWQEHTGKPFPEVIFVCPNKSFYNYLYKMIGGMLNEKGLKMAFFLCIWDEVKQEGMKKQVLNKVLTSQ
jgi:DNA-binding PadR family transcriptional regulator